MAQQPQASWLHINAYGMPIDEEERASITSLVETDIFAVLRGTTFFGLDDEDNLVYGQFLPNIGITFLTLDKTNQMTPLNYTGSALQQGGSKNTYYGFASDLGYEEEPSYIMIIEAQNTKSLPKEPQKLYQEIQTAMQKLLNDPSPTGEALREVINTEPEYLHAQLHEGYKETYSDSLMDYYKQLEAYQKS